MSDVSKRDRFQYWLAEMDDAIERLVNSAPSGMREKLDGSDESLSALEQWVLSKYANPSEASAASEAVFVDGAARYVGEVLRNRTGSKWGIDLENSKDVFYGIPTLRGGSLKVPLCPLTTVTASTDRRTGSYFSTILRNVRHVREESA
jgi:hypothetical protein